MNEEIKKQAFPLFLGFQPDQHHVKGMTLREYYAGQAIVGLLSQQPPVTLSGEERVRDYGILAARAFLLADAMEAASRLK